MSLRVRIAPHLPRCLVALLLGLPLLSSCGGSAAPVVPVRQVDHRVSDLAELGEVTEVVALETTDAALLGLVDRIVVDPETEDLLVGDFRSSQQVVRFARDGRYVASYTLPEVVESDMVQFRALAPLPGGRVVLTADDRASVFARNGTLLAHTAVPFAVDAAVFANGYLYLRGHNTGGVLREAVTAYRVQDDGRLEKVSDFHPYDERRDLFPFQPLHPLAAGGGSVFVSGLFEFRLSEYGLEGDLRQTWDLERSPTPMPAAWEKSRHELTDADRTAMRRSVHRIRTMAVVGDRLFLVEDDNRQEPVAITLGFLDLEEVVLHRYPGLRPVSRQATPDRLTFDGVPGTWDRGLLGIVDDPEKLALLGERYPRFSDLRYDSADNPLVVYFALKPLAEGGAVAALGDASVGEGER